MTAPANLRKLSTKKVVTSILVSKELVYPNLANKA
jgi:hypothetical protein